MLFYYNKKWLGSYQYFNLDSETNSNSDINSDQEQYVF
jgi:hypothetical protein